MKKAHLDDDLKSGHITPAGGNVFADLGFSPQQATVMLEDADDRIFKAQKLKTESALLRIDSWHRFSVMIVATEAAFKSDKLLKVYDVVNALESTVTNDQFHIRFSFVAGGKDLDPKALAADGYVLKLKS